jgi:nucleotide-binding universal stress UspA family protein
MATVAPNRVIEAVNGKSRAAAKWGLVPHAFASMRLVQECFAKAGRSCLTRLLRRLAWGVLNSVGMTNILVPLDGSPLAETVLPFVERLARRAGAHVTLLYVTPVPEGMAGPSDAPAVDRVMRRDRELAMSYLCEHRRRLDAAGIDTDVAVAAGRPATEIVRHADEAGIDLIALSTHGRSGVQAWTHGSVADQVLHTTRTPLLLVRPGDLWVAAPHGIEQIIVALDGSWESETALAVAERLAKPADLPIVLIRCVEPLSVGFVADPSGIPYVGIQATIAVMVQEARDYLEDIANRLRTRRMTVKTEVSVGAAAPGIAAYARCSPDSVVVLASHARSGWRRALLGSVARRITQTVPTPVVVCPVPRPGEAHRLDENGRVTNEAAARSA